MHNASLLAVLALLAASAPVPAAPKRGDTAELENYRLTVPVLKKLGQVQENIYEAIKKDPSLATKYKKDRDVGGDDSLDAMVKKMDAVPELSQAIKKAGLTTREYLLSTLATLQAVMGE